MKKPAAKKSCATILFKYCGFYGDDESCSFGLEKISKDFLEKACCYYIYFERSVFVSQKFEKWPSER
jgi:hypothetical protein